MGAKQAEHVRAHHSAVAMLAAYFELYAKAGAAG